MAYVNQLKKKKELSHTLISHSISPVMACPKQILRFRNQLKEELYLNLLNGRCKLECICKAMRAE